MLSFNSHSESKQNDDASKNLIDIDLGLVFCYNKQRSKVWLKNLKNHI